MLAEELATILATLRFPNQPNDIAEMKEEMPLQFENLSTPESSKVEL